MVFIDGQKLLYRVLANRIVVGVFPLSINDQRVLLPADQNRTHFFARFKASFDSAGVQQQCQPSRIAAPKFLFNFQKGKINRRFVFIQNSNMFVDVTFSHRCRKLNVKAKQVFGNLI